MYSSVTCFFCLICLSHVAIVNSLWCSFEVNSLWCSFEGCITIYSSSDRGHLGVSIFCCSE